MAEEHLRLVVVGAGIMGSNHVRVGRNLRDASLVAVVDPDLDRARAAAGTSGIEVVERVEQVVDRIDAAVVAVPTAQHVDTALELIEGGVHLLVEAFRGLDPERAQLDIHGHAVPYEGVDDYEADLRGLAAGAAHIRFGKAYRPEDVPSLLADADVLVVPSTWFENSPLTLHEAFLAGLPVVAAGHGGMAEFVVHEENGLHFEPGSTSSLRAALQRLVDDEALLARLAVPPPAVKSIEENAQELEACYRDLSAE